MGGACGIADDRLEGPELTAGLGSTGHLSWPVPKLGFDLEGVAIEHIEAKFRDKDAMNMPLENTESAMPYRIVVIHRPRV